MIHLFRVYFADVADATEVYADSHESAAKYVTRLHGAPPGVEPVVRYVKSVSRMRSDIPLVLGSFSEVYCPTKERHGDEQGI